MAGRFPGARNLDEFWRNLRDGVESVSFFTNEELLAEGLDYGLLSDPNYVGANAVLDDVEMFDASFFGFTPREAEITDPQHRLFLECALEVLESAGYEPGSYKGRIGVYAGAGLSTYLLNNLGPNRELIRSVSDFQILMGNNKDYVPTRVSYKLNLKGPSVNVQHRLLHLAGRGSHRVPEPAGLPLRHGAGGWCRNSGSAEAGLSVSRKAESPLRTGTAAPLMPGRRGRSAAAVWELSC